MLVFLFLSSQNALAGLTLHFSSVYSIYLYLILIAMVQTKKLDEQLLLSKDDFAWSRKMTNKDWNICKSYFDQLYSRLSKKDTEILSLNSFINELKNKNERAYMNMKRAEENEIMWKGKYNKIIKDARGWKSTAIVFIILSIVCACAPFIVDLFN